MNTASYIDAILENVARLLPVRIVHENEGAVRWTAGRAGPNLAKGIHWFCPFLQSIEVIDITVGSLNLGPQVVVTQDGVQCAIRSYLEWRVADVRKLLVVLEVDEADTAVKSICEGVIAEVVSEYPYKALWETTKVRGKARRKIARKVAQWGVKAVKIHFAEYPRVRAWRLFGEI